MSGCASSEEQPDSSQPVQALNGPVFSRLSADETGLTFSNPIKEDDASNYFTWEYFYNGGGVAVGDLDGDDLPDIYLTANQAADALYRNEGKLKFKDKSQVLAEAEAGWHTGVTMADINADGLLDIYVCRSGPFDASLRRNLLYLNKGNFEFEEVAGKLGLADEGNSVQAAFFDYDRDGDLDCYVMNHPAFAKKELTNVEIAALIKAGTAETDRLYRNDGGTFTDVSMAAGIMNHGFGLGLSVADIDMDGWLDIYVANDFDEGDYLYVNQKNGTFAEQVKGRTKHISNFGMGTDIADFNNDGFPDIMELDMAYADHVRSKRLMASMRPEKFAALVRTGRHFQYMTNTLQLNHGNGTFSEIAQLAGVAKTDWSWAPLFVDLDLDGWKDLVVTNGFKRDTRDNDFRLQLADKVAEQGKLTFSETVSLIPSTKVRNYLFQNTGDLRFRDVSEAWGFKRPFNSNGIAYADLDLDGDPDLVVNNMDESAAIYKNECADAGKRHYLTVDLRQAGSTAGAVGARVRLRVGMQQQVQTMMPTRGYQSAVAPVLHFGLGAAKTVNDLEVFWPDGRYTRMENVAADQRLRIEGSEATANAPIEMVRAGLFGGVTPEESGIDYIHREQVYDDFASEILLPHKQSQLGPMIATGDANGDGRDDFYIGGGLDTPGAVYVQGADGRFTRVSQPTWQVDRQHEDMGALFFDADGDGDQDLYVVSGGNERGHLPAQMQDRLYLNDGQANFSRAAAALPVMPSSGMRVAGWDVDGDGDTDLFVGGRAKPGAYPVPDRSYFLRNDGGVFMDVTAQWAPDLLAPGMVSDVLFTDFDGDEDRDLILVGEWMKISMFEHIMTKDGFMYVDKTEEMGLQNSSGWWNRIAAGDFNGDGRMDYSVGNLGLNSKFKASVKKPVHVWYSDFDGNGTGDIVLGKLQNDICYPVRGRECSSEQMPFIKDKFPTYKGFAEASIEDIYSKDKLDAALHFSAVEMRTSVMIQQADGTFSLEPLPIETQFSPVNGIIVMDIDGDGNEDLVTAGNNFETEVETVRYDAGVGTCLLGDGKGGFKALSLIESSFFAPTNVKDLALVQRPAPYTPLILIANNAYLLRAYQLKATGS